MKMTWLEAGLDAALVAGLALASTSAQAQEGRSAIPFASLPSYVSSEDYPLDALMNQQEGTVAFRLGISESGKVSDCTVEESSGVPSLDQTTCRVLTERATFAAATGADGKPTTDQVTGRINWKLAEEKALELPKNRTDALFFMWGACSVGESMKRIPSEASAPQVAEGALSTCTSLETAARTAFTGAMPDPAEASIAFDERRESLRGEMVKNVNAFRRLLLESKQAMDTATGTANGGPDPEN